MRLTQLATWPYWGVVLWEWSHGGPCRRVLRIGRFSVSFYFRSGWLALRDWRRGRGPCWHDHLVCNAHPVRWGGAVDVGPFAFGWHR
jgi:hypothetical protein